MDEDKDAGYQLTESERDDLRMAHLHHVEDM